MVSKKKKAAEVEQPVNTSLTKKHKLSLKELENSSKKSKKDSGKNRNPEDEQVQRVSSNFSNTSITKKRKIEEIKVQTPPAPKMQKKSDSSSDSSDDSSDDSDDEQDENDYGYSVKVEDEEEDEHIKDEPESPQDLIDEEVENVSPAHVGEKEDLSAIPEWPEADLHELISRMIKSLPMNDSLKFESRVEKLDWGTIAFGDYEAGQCKNMWLRIQKRVRRFRVLRELLEDAKTWVSKPWTSFYRSSKLNRHPDLPRRPLSTYMLYYMDKKDKVAKQHPGLDMTAVSKLIGEQYKSLSESKKKVYIEKAKAIREEYDEKMEIFYREHPELAQKNDQSEGRARRNESKPPLRPKTPFMLFLNEQITNQKDNPEFDKNLIKEKCRQLWRSMSDKKKVVWINWALEAETKYKESIKTYVFKNPTYKPPILKNLLTKEEKLIVERSAGKPVKPPNSGYSLFSRLMLASAEIKQIDSKQRMSQISSLWKSLSDEKKKTYQEEVIHMLDQYKLEYATYLESLSEEKRREELLASFPKRKMIATKSRTSSKPKPKSSAIATVKQSKATKPKKKQVQETPIANLSINKTALYKGEPTPPPVNVYQLFRLNYMKKVKTGNSSKLESELTQKWKMLPENEKSKYTRELDEMKEKYIKDFEKFLRSLSQEELKEYSSLKKSSQTDDLSSSASNSESSDDDDDDNDNDNDNDDGGDDDEAQENNENGEEQNSNDENDSDSSQDEPVQNASKVTNSNKDGKSSNQESDDDSSSSDSSSDSSSSDSEDSD